MTSHAKARIEEAKRALARELGPARAAELMAALKDKGWDWGGESTAEVVGMLVCTCGFWATVNNRERYSRNCPACGQALKMAEIQ